MADFRITLVDQSSGSRSTVGGGSTAGPGSQGQSYASGGGTGLTRYGRRIRSQQDIDEDYAEKAAAREEKKAFEEAQKVARAAQKAAADKLSHFTKTGGNIGRAIGAFMGQGGGAGSAIAGGEIGSLLGGGAGAAAAGGGEAGVAAAAGALGPALAPLIAATGPAAVAIGAVAVAAYAAKKGFDAFMAAVDHFVARGEQLAPYSGAIAGARAQANVRQIMGDIREANQLGDSIARLTDAQSRFNDDIRKIMEPIKRVIAEVLAGLMERLAKWLDEVTPDIAAGLEEIIGTMKAMYEAIVNWDFAKAAEEMQKAHDRAEKARHYSTGNFDFMANFLGGGFAEDTFRPDQPHDPMKTQAAQGTNGPQLGVA